MAGEWRVSSAACFLAAITISSAVSAACRLAPPSLLASTPAIQPYVDRFNVLSREDPYLLTDRTAAGWRELVGDLQRDGHHPPADLVARSQMMLAGSLKGDAVEKSLDIAQAALAFADAEGVSDSSLHAALETMLAAKEVDAGRTAQAVGHAGAALAEAERTDGQESWLYGHAAETAAAAHFANGDYAAAERLAATAEQLAIACLPSDVAIIGSEIQSHAATLSTLGRTDEALAEGERALSWDVAHLPESNSGVTDALEDVGFTLRNANRLREAEAMMRRASDLDAHYRPDDAFARASVAGKLGNILVAEGKYREAEAVLLNAEALYARSHNLSNPLAGSGELRRAADAAQEQGKLEEALDLRQRAVALIASRVQPRHPELARARIEYATTLAVAGRPKEGLAVAEPAVAVLRETAPPGDFKRMGAEIAFALVARAAGVDPVKVFAVAKPDAARMEEVLLDSATSRGDLIRFAPTFANSFAAVVRLALAAHDEEAAFHALQLANLSDIVLVNAEVTARAAAVDPQVRRLIEQLNLGEREHRRLGLDRLAANASGDAAKALADDAAIRRAEKEAAETAKALDNAFPAFRALTRPKPVALADFRPRLGADDVVLAPLTLPGETVVVALTREGLHWTTVGAPRARVTSLVADIRNSIEASRQDPRARFNTVSARALGAILLPPALAPVITAHHHLVYYTSGALATVPPALLVTSAAPRRAAPAWLIRSHSVSIAVSLTTPSAVDRTPRKGFLGVGAPVLGGAPLTLAERGVEVKADDFGKGGISALPPLPDAARELRAMGALFPPAQRRVLTGAMATKPVLRSLQLDRYGVIAFATHGLVADALPGLTQPALVLTPAPGGGSANDGLLTASEIAGLHLDADWVILSACDTAGGSDPQSGSYSGLASAFIEAGARALLVSHWPVRDDAAARITVATLAATRRGIDRATALQHAMLALMRDRKVAQAMNPAIWGPFVIIDH